jgi:hypothetical protein
MINFDFDDEDLEFLAPFSDPEMEDDDDDCDDVDVDTTENPSILLLRASLQCAIFDSVYYSPEIRPGLKKKTLKNYQHQSNETTEIRKQTREWIRACEDVVSESQFGFGHVWKILQWAGGVRIPAKDFIAKMETIWAAVDADHSLAKEIIAVLRGTKQKINLNLPHSSKVVTRSNGQIAEDRRRRVMAVMEAAV